MEPKDLDFRAAIAKRYGNVDENALKAVLCPVLIPVATLDKTIHRIPGQNHYRASFTIIIDESNRVLMQSGRTGKFVPKSYVVEGSWREIAKGRILGVDVMAGIAEGEIYVGGGLIELQEALNQLSETDYLEIDQYGAAAKVLSGLVEYTLAKKAGEQGYIVRRMPEDVAKHVSAYYYYDFEFERAGMVKKVEVKSLWGTNTRFACLIHSQGSGYPTSSCRFDTQDFFAVSLFLRTGNIHDFAFARSISRLVRPYGLSPVPKYPDHVTQNPECVVGNGTWFGSIDEVWDLP